MLNSAPGTSLKSYISNLMIALRIMPGCLWRLRGIIVDGILAVVDSESLVAEGRNIASNVELSVGRNLDNSISKWSTWHFIIYFLYTNCE